MRDAYLINDEESAALSGWHAVALVTALALAAVATFLILSAAAAWDWCRGIDE